jgi:pyruvate-formate lyase-activating enzyme
MSAIAEFKSIEPAIDPNNRITFLLDWEITMKCNLDCSYCPTGIYGGHDNSTKHPTVAACAKTIDFMFRYVDLYMSTKPKGIKYVILNVYGGESLHHPDIVKILETVRKEHAQYQDQWNLTITTTTNAIVSNKILKSIIPLIDEFTVSYHSEHTTKQRQQFKNNLLSIAQAKKRIKCVILMHPDPELFAGVTNIIEWLNTNEIRYLPRQLDHGAENTDFNYDQKQVIWFNNLYNTKNYNSSTNLSELSTIDKKYDLSATGRACCGGRQLCKDSNYKNREFFVSNRFTDWYCSVNHFFLYIKQVNGEVYVNKDCKMNFNGSVGPIGNLNNSDYILNTLQNYIDTNTMPVIQCKKSQCFCGLCAPKAKNLETYNKIMKKYQLTL